MRMVSLRFDKKLPLQTRLFFYDHESISRVLPISIIITFYCLSANSRRFNHRESGDRFATGTPLGLLKSMRQLQFDYPPFHYYVK